MYIISCSAIPAWKTFWMQSFAAFCHYNIKNDSIVVVAVHDNRQTTATKECRLTGHCAWETNK